MKTTTLYLVYSFDKDLPLATLFSKAQAEAFMDHLEEEYLNEERLDTEHEFKYNMYVKEVVLEED